MRFRFHFKGREKGAIGIFHAIVAVAEGADLDAASLSLYERYEHISHGKHVRLMWAPTWVPPETGLRTLMTPNQGRCFFETKGEAEAWINAVTRNNSAELVANIWGKNPRFEAREVECYDHGDAIGIYF